MQRSWVWSTCWYSKNTLLSHHAIGCYPHSAAHLQRRRFPFLLPSYFSQNNDGERGSARALDNNLQHHSRTKGRKKKADSKRTKSSHAASNDL